MLYSLLEKTAQSHPDSIALWSDNYSCTYSELNEQVIILSRGLLKQGMKKGDRLASYLHSCPEAVQLYFACFKIGVSIVVIHPFYREVEVRLLIETATPKLFVTQLELYKNLQNLTEQFVSIIKCYYLIDCVHHNDSNMLRPFSNLKDTNYLVEEHVTEITGEQEATIILTSGTTGKSKCVQSNHYQKLCSVNRFEALSLGANDKFLLTTPMNSLSGLDVCILPSVRCGASIRFLPTNLPRQVYIKRIPPVLYEENITYTAFISSTLRSLVEEIKLYTKEECRKNSLRYLLFAGERLSPTSFDKARKCLGLDPIEGYGMTETNGFIAISAAHVPQPGQLKPCGDTKFRITNDHWEDMPTNTCGEITVHSGSIMCGYLNDEKTTEKVLKDGWLKTGDIGYLESNGTLTVVGRIKQIVICNGLNVNLLELEEVLLECNDVYEVCATSIPYMESEKPVVYVSLHSSFSADVNDVKLRLFSYLKEKVADFKIPLYIQILDALPKNVIGKVDRKVLTERALQEFVQKQT